MRPLPIVAVIVALAALAIAAFIFVSPSLDSGAPPAAQSAPSTPKDKKPLEAAADASGSGSAPEKSADPAVAEPTGGAARETAVDEATAQAAQSYGYVTGLVLDFDGKPVAGAKIRFLSKKSPGMGPMGMTAEPDGESDAKGRFKAKLEVKKKKTMKLRVTAKNHLPITVPEVSVRRGETEDVGTLQFAPAGAEVAVFDTEHRPIPNIQVSLNLVKPEIKPEQFDPSNRAESMEKAQAQFESAMEMMRGERRTDDQGVARFSALPAQRVTATVSTRGLMDFDFVSEISDAADAVKTDAADSAKSGDESAKDPKGRFKRLMDRVNNKRSQSAPEPKEIAIEAGAAQRLEFTLERMAVLTGRASEHGNPVANEWLAMRKRSAGAGMMKMFGTHVRAMTDADGKFAFPPVPPGKYIVEKGDPGPAFDVTSMAEEDNLAENAGKFASSFLQGPPKNDHARDVELREGNNQSDVDFGGSLVEVIVQDADSGTPVSDASVSLSDIERGGDKAENDANGIAALKTMFGGDNKDRRSVRLKSTSDARGHVEFRDLEPGLYRVVARADQRPVSQPVDFDVSGAGITKIIKLPAGMLISGTVNDAQGRAIEDATVQCIEESNLNVKMDFDITTMFSGDNPRGVTNGKGEFHVKGCSAGAHSLLAWADGYAPSYIRASAPSEGNNLFLNKVGSIRATVRRDGAPVKGVLSNLDGSGEDAPEIARIMRKSRGVSSLKQMNWTGMTNDDGVAEIKNVPPAEWTAVANGSFFGGFEGPKVSSSAGGGGVSVTTKFTADLDEKIGKRAQQKEVRKRVSVGSGQQSLLYIDLPPLDTNGNK